MTWLETPATLAKLEEDSFAEFRKRMPPLPSTLYHAEAAVDAAQSSPERWQEVDLACSSFAASHQWPPDMSFLVWMDCLARLRQARQFADFVSDPARRAPWNHVSQKFEYPDLLRWLLVEYYHVAGFFREMYEFFAGKKLAA